MTDQPASESEFRKAVEHFGRAVAVLALGSGTLQERLRDAWVQVLPVKAHDIPEEVRGQFEAMESTWLSAEEPTLNDAEAADAARAILLLEAELLTLLGVHARDRTPRQPAD